MSSKPFRCVVIAEGDIDGVYAFESAEAMDGFREGVGVGASLYGAGSCRTYTEDDIDRDLEAYDIDWDTAQALRKALREVQP